MKRVLFETDWLASKPVFYNEKSGKASHNINDVIDYANIEFDPEGFNNFLDFGYSVLEYTPVKGVKFLRHSAQLLIDENGKIAVEYLNDPTEAWLHVRYSESDIFDLTRSKIRNWEASFNGEIVIPTSGGFDSRLLNLMVEDKTRIRSFTYGIAENQSQSSEVVFARELSKILGTRWEQIPLGDFHKYFDYWDSLYGVSTHAHGMYHVEFYTKILEKVSPRAHVLSGIIGDAWAGISISPIQSVKDVFSLGYTHGICADSNNSLFNIKQDYLADYFERNKQRLLDPRLRVIEAMRFKIILLSYLITIPESLGLNCWSPFLDIETAMAMLNLPDNRRKGRIWQKEFFKKNGINIEEMGLKATSQNTLDIQGLIRMPVRPLNAELLKNLFRPDYIESINKTLSDTTAGWRRSMLLKLLSIQKVSAALRKIGFSRNLDTLQTAYNGYLVLTAIENLLRR